ncbi:uncharacterized protein [Bemisia tabaci]|uniref:uncharacterized protein n=1 Tax=Bemisia tabaci TaxID=7038 RepID=UPI003B2815F6
MTQIMRISVCLMAVIAMVACAPLESGESLKTDESVGLGLGLGFKKIAKSFDFGLGFALSVDSPKAYPAYYGYHPYGYGYPHYYPGGAAAAAAAGPGGAAAAAAAGK